MRGPIRLVIGLALASLLCLASAGQALASPAWRLDAFSNTTVAPGATLTHFVQLTNVGDQPTDGSTLVWRARLPTGMTTVSAQLFNSSTFASDPCFDARDGTSPAAGASSLICTSTQVVPNASQQKLRLTTRADLTASGTLTPEFRVSGGGAAPITAVDPVIVSSVPPDFGIDAFDGQITADAAGNPETQAGAHPYAAQVSVDFNTFRSADPLEGDLWPAGPLKDVLVDLPPGLVGDPTAADRCTLSELANMSGSTGARPLCSPTSQVGTSLVRLRGSEIGPTVLVVPVFNLVPPPGVPARFGFNLVGTLIVLDGELRSGGDYGLSVNTRNVPQALGISGTTVTFWGVPAAPSHDLERACSGEGPPANGGPTCRSGAPLRPFLRNPTSCTAPGVGLPTTAHIDAWDDPGVFRDATFLSHNPPAYPAPPSSWGLQTGATGCDAVPFRPTFVASPASRAGSKPAGFTFDLSIPQSDDPDQIGQADLRAAHVTLPLGVRVSPSSADGLGACDPAQIRIHDGSVPTCPDSSKIGSVTIDTPLLEEPLTGAVYLAKPRDNPFGSLLSVYIAAEGPGVVVKLAGKVDADPISGQLTTTFDDNPQLPFSNLHLEFKAGPRAPLVMPQACGTYTTHAELTGWNGAIVASDSSFDVTDSCGPGFNPKLEAGTQNPVAGRSSTFTLRVSRGDEDQELSNLTLNMPSGLTGKIADVTLCGDADVKANTCPAGSKVGDVTVGAGAGPDPFYITNGKAYFTGPYKGAPFGLAVVVPAVAGPFDLGLVTVRQAVFVDKHTAELRVVSDPFPTILEGIPLSVRDVRVAINRKGFFLNPTSCAAKTISGTATSTQGVTAPISTRFQVGDCGNLPLAPKMTLTVGSPGRTGRNSSTPLTATLRQSPGQSNLKSVKVSLPTTINARLPIVNRACTRAQFEAGNCDRARAGTAIARTPLLKDPLKGNAYFVRNGHPIPDLFVALRGQVDFDLMGRVTIPGSKHLATTFDMVPDVPITSFSLRFVAGASRGPVGTTTNLCSRRGRTATASIDFVGQNGSKLHVDQRLNIRGCGSTRGGRRGRSAKR